MVYKIVYGFRFNKKKIVRYGSLEEEDRQFLIQKEFEKSIPTRSIFLYEVPETNYYILGIPLCFLTIGQTLDENSLSICLPELEKKYFLKVWSEKKLTEDYTKAKPELFFF